MVLGETEITGQVKRAYEQARSAGLTGRILNQVFQKALQTAKEIRTQTAIGRGVISVGSVAAEVAERIFGQALASQTVLVLGAGQMGEACVRHLTKKGVRSLLIANRCLERAQSLVAQVGGRAVPFDQYSAALAEADIVIASTGCPHLLVTQAGLAELMPARRNRPLFLVDISVPRNIDPAAQLLQNVYLYNIDDLQAVVRENVRHREQALANCQEIIRRNVAALTERLAGRTGAVPAHPSHNPQPAWGTPGGAAIVPPVAGCRLQVAG